MSGEFPPGVDAPPDLDRRAFLQLLGASAALAGAAGCSVGPSGEPIVPYTVQPPDVTPGRSSYYATAIELDGYGRGLLVQSTTGRPLKIEGNPAHPASLGATDVYDQASILDLYSPFRASSVTMGGTPSGWQVFLSRLPTLVRGAGSGGRGIEILLEPTSSATVARLLSVLRQGLPEIGVSFYQPFSPAARWSGAELVFGRALEPLFSLTEARVVASFGADLLGSGPFHVRYAHDFAEGRRLLSRGATMNRLYVAETALTETGTVADHRLAVPPLVVGALLAELLHVLLTEAGGSNGSPPAFAAPRGAPGLSNEQRAWVRALARDLSAHRGQSLVVAGEAHPAHVQALAHAVNSQLGNVSATVRYLTPSVLGELAEHGLERLRARLMAGDVELLLVLGGDPAYNAPRDLAFVEALRRARHSIYLGTRANATSAATSWTIPAAHFLEAWGDTRALDGTATIIQPLVRPLYEGKTSIELLSALVGDTTTGLLQQVQTTWQAQLPATAWEEALRTGIVPNSAASAIDVSLSWSAVERAFRATVEQTMANGRELGLGLTAASPVHDGRFIDNPWLLELPGSTTKLTWGNAALMAPRTAERLEVTSGDLVRLNDGAASVELPVLVQPGHAEEAVTATLGFGQRAVMGPGRDVGVDVYPLWRGEPVTGRVTLTKLGEHQQLALTQTHWDLGGRPHVLATTLEELRDGERIGKHVAQPHVSFHPLEPDAAQQWGMSIDLNVCTGCSACVVACQAENNIPVVGRAGVIKSREMHWLRIDMYFDGPPESPRVTMQPMLCQHCEKAPCEYVCPTHATVHSPDGLNEMVYNRCVGTRFCSNNCPYKVRRFNWFDYNRDKSEPERLAMNPQVTVRARGVMEKCTFCVQRIRRAGIEARLQGRQQIAEGALQTACQQACATGAIVFGDVRDANTRVSKLQRSERAYGVLADLNTAPRVRYLARVRNTNPEVSS